MNDVVVPWCRAQKIEVTRSRAYKKNDQAFVEQKDGAIVRRLVGYGRFDGVDTARMMAHLYAAARLHVNFFPALVQAQGEAAGGEKQHSIVQRLLKALRRKAAERVIAETTAEGGKAKIPNAGVGGPAVGLRPPSGPPTPARLQQHRHRSSPAAFGNISP